MYFCNDQAPYVQLMYSGESVVSINCIYTYIMPLYSLLLHMSIYTATLMSIIILSLVYVASQSGHEDSEYTDPTSYSEPTYWR